MADIDWAILCDYAFLDVGRKTCMIGVFQRVFAPNVPATHHQAAIVIRFTGDPAEKVKFKIDILRPLNAGGGGGGTLATLNGEAHLGDSGAAEFSTNIAGLPLPDYGDYAFNIYVDDKLAKIVTFTVAHFPGQPSGDKPTPPQD